MLRDGLARFSFLDFVFDLESLHNFSRIDLAPRHKSSFEIFSSEPPLFFISKISRHHQLKERDDKSTAKNSKYALNRRQQSTIYEACVWLPKLFCIRHRLLLSLQQKNSSLVTLWCKKSFNFTREIEVIISKNIIAAFLVVSEFFVAHSDTPK